MAKRATKWLPLSLAVAVLATMAIRWLDLTPRLGLVAQVVDSEPSLPASIADLMARAEAARDAGRQDEAIGLLDQALAAAEPGTAGQGWALRERGMAAWGRGEYYRALSWCQQGLEIFQALGDRYGESVVLHDLGLCFTSIGERARARDHYERALEHPASQADRAITLSHLASLEDLDGDHRLSYDHFCDAFILRGTNLGESEKDRLQGKGVLLDRMGSALASLGLQPCGQTTCEAKAHVAYSSAVELLSHHSQPLYRAISRSNLGRLALVGCIEDDAVRCRPDEALKHFDQALMAIADADHPDNKIIYLSGKTQALRFAGRLAEAQATAEEALQMIEGMRTKALQPLLKTAYATRHRHLIDELVLVLMARHRQDPGAGYDRRGLMVSELARGRSLLERIHPTAGRQLDENLAAEVAALRQEMNELEHRRLVAVERLTRQGVLADPMSPAWQEVGDLERLQRQLALRAEAPLRHLASQGEETSRWPLDSDDLLRSIDSETVVLSYFLSPTQSFLWAADAQRVEVFELPPASLIEEQVKDVHAALAAGDQPRSDTELDAEWQAREVLSRTLLADVTERWAGRRLVILADGALHRLPFAALIHPATGQPLVTDHQLIRLPSLAMRRALMTREASRLELSETAERTMVGLMADPVYRSSEALSDDSASACNDGLPVPSDLPWGRQEGDVIRRLVSLQGWTLVEPETTRQALLDGALSTSRIVHLAVHGMLDGERPDFSHLTLSRFSPQGECLDSRLFAHEIHDLDLAADLVVLSGCETGRGTVLAGEGVVGMTQAMLAAGASRALVSLWKVDDQATAELMALFYGGLIEQRLPPAQALQVAQQEMLASPFYGDPFFWAGFVLVGDWSWPGLPEPVPMPVSSAVASTSDGS